MTSWYSRPAARDWSCRTPASGATAFHRTLPPEAFTLALPKSLRDAGLRRYGFHGLSYENVAEALPSCLPPGQTKVIPARDAIAVPQMPMR